MYTQTTATLKLSRLRKRIRGVSGGTSASKTISILLLLLDYAQTHPGEMISVVSETFPHLKRGAMRDFENIMKEHNYWNEANWNATDKIYTFGTTKLEFFSADQSDKVRGPRRDVLFINEANNIPYATYEQLEIRTKKIIWLDWNPVSAFWWYEDENGGPGVKDTEDADFIILTYLDNEALDPAIVKSIEAKKEKKNFWKVFGLGQLGESEGRIYTGWAVIDEIPHEARLVRYGLDFGYTNDPSSVVAVYRYNGGFIIDEILYQRGLSNKQIADVIINNPRALIIGDSAEPKSIDEIGSYGLSILPTTKGPGSILQGIQYVQDQRISVTKRSVHTIKEYRNYLWQTDKDGTIINEPEDIWNHSMDAIRYALRSINPERETNVDNKQTISKWARAS